MSDRIQQRAAQWHTIKNIDKRKQETASRQVRINDIDLFPVKDEGYFRQRSDWIKVDNMESDIQWFYKFDQRAIWQDCNDRIASFQKLSHACKKYLLTAPDFRGTDCEHNTFHFNISFGFTPENGTSRSQYFLNDFLLGVLSAPRWTIRLDTWWYNIYMRDSKVKVF